MSQEQKKKKGGGKKLLLSLVRWGIAVVGIWWVVSNMSLRDSVLLLNPETNIPQRVSLLQHAPEDAPSFIVADPKSGQATTVERSRVINPATIDDKPKRVMVESNGVKTEADILGMQLRGDINSQPSLDGLLIRKQGSTVGEWISPADVVGGYKLDVPRPKVEVGIKSLVANANPWLLVLSVIIFPITFIITSYRWYRLTEVADVHIGIWRAFMINMVGAFYNTFMPGSVGGDVFKMYYASKQTPHRMRAVVSVAIDRVLGLLALVMLGGVMAAYQYVATPDASKSDPTARACLQVALGSIAILAAVGIGLAVLFEKNIRRLLGLEFILSKLPMQRQIENAREVARVYRRRPVFMLVMLLIGLPVHITVIISALFAGKAFGLPLQPIYYFTVVPVVVLVGSIPISPQGAGVMEFFAILLTQRQAATVSQAFALTMSIRVVQILWNLTGGIFVLTGGFHAPTEQEQQELDDIERRGDEDLPPDAPAGEPTDGPTQPAPVPPAS
jgi:uncharacterized protein (TIRG00374 family)